MVLIKNVTNVGKSALLNTLSLHQIFCFSFAKQRGGEIRVINNSGKNNTFSINNMKLWNIEIP